MTGDSGYSSLGAARGCGAVRLLSAFLIALFLACIPQGASAQLPGGKKPAEFSPTIPDFDNPSADWWSGWEGASHQQREEWQKALSEAWEKHRETLPEDEDKELQQRAQAISEAIKRIEGTWKKREKYQREPLLEEVKFPEEPNVLDWAKADALVSHGRERLRSLELEAEQLDDALSQSLDQLGRQILALREQKEAGEARDAAVYNLLLAQVDHLDLVEQRDLVAERRSAWTGQLDGASAELEQMLDQLRFSEDAQKTLDATIEEEKEKSRKLDEQRSELQSQLNMSTSPEANMKKTLSLMAVEMAQLESALELRKGELLVSINDVLGPQRDQAKLIANRDIQERAHAVVENVSDELRRRLRQVTAWRGQEIGDLDHWWPDFEKIYSSLLRTRGKIEDLSRYEAAELRVFKEHQGQWATVRERAEYLIDNARKHWRELADYPLFTIAKTPITLRQIAKIILVLLSAWIISGLTRRFLNRMVRKKHASESSMYNLGRVLHYSIIAIALLVALFMLGLDTTKLALVAGALSVGIGFGLQAIFSNFISGLILLFEQPLRVGDLVELESGVFGRIRDINVRSTRITTRDNVDILVPNSEFVSGRVINHTLDDPVRRIHVNFGVSYDSDPDQVMEAAVAASERVAITYTDWRRKTEVWLMGFGDSSLDFRLVVWIDSNMVSHLDDPYALYNVELLKEFRERGIEIPFPQRDLHFRSGEPPLLTEPAPLPPPQPSPRASSQAPSHAPSQPDGPPPPSR